MISRGDTVKPKMINSIHELGTKMPRPVKLYGSLVAALLAALLLAGKPEPPGDVFARENLVAWCIIPYDSIHRTPLERARMLRRLGIQRLAIDWRAKDIPNFDGEIDVLRKNQITLHSSSTP